MNIMVKKANINKTIIKIALKFKKILEEMGTPIEKLIIFGSYAKKKGKC